MVQAKSTLLIAGTIMAGLTAAAHATPVVWNFESPTGNLNSNTHTYSPTTSQPGYTQSITATGFHCSSTPCAASSTLTPVNLFGKADGGDESGLGLVNDPSGDNEITPGNFIQLDLSQLTDPPLTRLTISFGTNSTTSPDSWQVFACPTGGVFCSNMIDQGTSEGVIDPLPNFAINGPNHFLDITAGAGNILISEVNSDVTSSTSVPEPASLALLGSALAGLGFIRRRCRQTASV